MRKKFSVSVEMKPFSIVPYKAGPEACADAVKTALAATSTTELRVSGALRAQRALTSVESALSS